jgi:hypothetical protein
LLGLAAARGVQQFERDTVLLEDADLFADMRDRGVPVPALTDRDLHQTVSGRRRQMKRERREEREA